MEKLLNDDSERKIAYIKFVDTDKYNSQSNKQVGDSISLQGRAGETVSLKITLPKKYELANNYSLPATYTFLKNQKNILVIPLVHKKEVEEITLVGKRTINYKIVSSTGIVNNLNDGRQKLEFKAKKTTDLLTGKVYFDWQKEQDNYSSVTTPIEKGYYASRIQADDKEISIDKIITNQQKIDEHVLIIYRPLGAIIQQDINGKELARFNYDNALDSTKAAKISIPETPNGYQAISKLPLSLIPSNPEADTVLTYRPNNNSQFRKVTRMVTEIQTNGVKKTHLQEVEFENVNGVWKLAPGTKLKWNIITPDIPEGYTVCSIKNANGQDYDKVIKKENGSIFAVDAVKPKFDTPNEDITIFIKPDLQKTSIDFIDLDSHDRKVIKSIPLEGRTNETVAFEISQRDVPAGYELINRNKIPTSYNFKAKYNSAIIVSIKKVETKKQSLKIKLY
ncbi:hypothetical protein [Lactobacillus sp. LL6]|uniref:mucin-binding protein n=1 Tax=Lactobacillus sp. LL6 TaxID=2596827 RepID=UPI001184B74D|nr:hypothetical protein [Lactobacillus sp. LL6]TSO26228.1 hypothetical protein FOD82_03915 [Lactobacillus sp. LL6]